MSDLRNRIEGLFAREQFLKARQKLLVGVSGGLDSMVLLRLLQGLAEKHRWQLGALHVNHGLRGRASAADERFVRRQAAQMRIPFFAEKHDVAGAAKALGISMEMAARKARHETFGRVAKGWRCRNLALAHHLDDQIELFFLRLFRGAGAKGLGGMTIRSAFPGDQRITILRPLLEIGRSELAAYAKDNRVRFREDASNADEEILRNRVRHRLVPLVERDFQPALKEVIRRSMELLRDADQAAGEAARLFAGEHFEEIPASIQRRLLHERLIQLGFEPDFELINRLLSDPDRPVNGPGGRRLRLKKDGAIELLPKQAVGFQTGKSGIIVDEEQRGVFAGLEYWSRLYRRRPRLANGTHEAFDAERLGREICLRHWREGDRFQPIGMPKPVKLQDLFVNAKIPREQRRRLVLLENAAGEICWVEGLRTGEVAKIRAESRRFWRWEWKRRRWE